MQPDHFYTFLKITAVFILIAACMFYGRREKKPVKKIPSAKDHLYYYQADFTNLSDEIRTARNIYHLKAIGESITDFKKHYSPHQCPVELQIDVNNLRRMWREKKTSLEIRLVVFN